MKRILIFTAFVAVLMAGFSGCTIRQKAVPVAPLNAQVNFDMDDLEYIGDVTGETTQSYLLGFIPYGGRKYHAGVLVNQSLGFGLPGLRGWNNALYDALMQQPNADFVLPVSFETITEQQFLGRRQMLTVRCKAYRIKNK